LSLLLVSLPKPHNLALFAPRTSIASTKMSEMRRAVIKNADMSDEMQQDAVDVATAALVRLRFTHTANDSRTARDRFSSQSNFRLTPQLTSFICIALV
jgi:hypothetical protein